MKQINISELSVREQHDAINEVHIMASLSNPYVVRYYDSFLDPHTGILCIIMEACEEGDLQHYLKAYTPSRISPQNSLNNNNNAPPFLPEEAIWNIFIQITIGLAYLHSKRTLHRDLKSANIFLTQIPKVTSPTTTTSIPSMDYQFGIKIGDLGVARVLGTDSYFAKTCVGTPYYLSPELCEDKPYNEKSDVWALGCVLYELCTGKHAFDARNQGALILKIIQGKYPPISTTYSNELHVLVNRLLNRDVRIRPTTAEVLNDSIIREKIQTYNFSIASSIMENIQQLNQEANLSYNINNNNTVINESLMINENEQKESDDHDDDNTSHIDTFPPSLNIAIYIIIIIRKQIYLRHL